MSLEINARFGTKEIRILTRRPSSKDPWRRIAADRGDQTSNLKGNEPRQVLNNAGRKAHHREVSAKERVIKDAFSVLEENGKPEHTL